MTKFHVAHKIIISFGRGQLVGGAGSQLTIIDAHTLIPRGASIENMLDFVIFAATAIIGLLIILFWIGWSGKVSVLAIL